MKIDYHHDPQSEATNLMEPTTLTLIMSLKKDLINLIEANDYNLLSPEVIELSCKIDRLMLPLFKHQQKKQFPYLIIVEP